MRVNGSPIDYKVLSRSSTTQARRGRLKTRHSVIETPVFMPVGTMGSVKSLDPRDLETMGAQICLANAYHLMLRPGDESISQLGGLHTFSGWKGGFLTDSGGFQVFSLKGMRKVSDAGVEFRSHVDGSLHMLSPERLVTLQENLGPDIAMVIDECPPGDADRDTVARAVKRTTAWAKRCLDARTRDDVAWFGIVQGALFDDMRRAHAETIASMDFDGVAIGGVSVGEAPEEIDRIVALTAPLLPENSPRYLMGVGTPADLIRGVAAGVDMFDCVMPTRNARNGNLFTSTGRVIIKHAAHRDSDRPLDENCPCYTCQTFSRAFLRHLFVSREITYNRLGTIHNLTHYLRLMQAMREAIAADSFDVDGLLKTWGAL